MHAAVAAPRITLTDIRAARERLGERIRRTPVQALSGPAVAEAFAPGTLALMKLELFQHTGSFKARSALLNALMLPDGTKPRIWFPGVSDFCFSPGSRACVNVSGSTSLSR